MQARPEVDTRGTSQSPLSAFSNSDAWSGVARAFERAVDTPSLWALSTLEMAVTEAARRLRSAGVPPERAVVTLKTALARHGGAGWTPSLDAGSKASRADARTYALLFPWFLAAFFQVSVGGASRDKGRPPTVSHRRALAWPI